MLIKKIRGDNPIPAHVICCSEKGLNLRFLVPKSKPQQLIRIEYPAKNPYRFYLLVYKNKFQDNCIWYGHLLSWNLKQLDDIRAMITGELSMFLYVCMEMIAAEVKFIYAGRVHIMLIDIRAMI